MQTILEQGPNIYRIDSRKLDGKVAVKVKLEMDGCETVYADITEQSECCLVTSLSFSIAACISKVGLWCITLLDADLDPIATEFVNVSKNLY